MVEASCWKCAPATGRYEWGEAEASGQYPVPSTQYPVPSTQYPENGKSLPQREALLFKNSVLSTRYSELGFDDFAALQALRADAHAFAARADFGPDGAKVHVPAPFGDVVGVADVVSRARLLAADRADLCHSFPTLRSNSEGLTAKGTSERSV